MKERIFHIGVIVLLLWLLQSCVLKVDAQYFQKDETERRSLEHDNRIFKAVAVISFFAVLALVFEVLYLSALIKRKKNECVNLIASSKEFVKQSERELSDKELVARKLRSDYIKLYRNQFAYLEKIIDERLENAMSSFRQDFPDMKQNDYRFVSFLFAGFDATTIMLIMKMSSQASVYTKKSRIKKMVQDSDADKKRFPYFMPAALSCGGCKVSAQERLYFRP